MSFIGCFIDVFPRRFLLFINKQTIIVLTDSIHSGYGKRKNKTKVIKMLQEFSRHLRTSASSGSVSGLVCVSCQSEINRPIKISSTSRHKKWSSLHKVTL